MAENNDSKWDKNFVAAVVAIVVGAVVTIATPELRKLFCLEKDNPAPQQQTVQTVPQPSPTPTAPSSEPTPNVQPETRKPAAVVQPKKKEPVAKPKPPSGPFSATLQENQPQRIEAAKTSLSILFNEEYKIVTLTIAPDGKQLPNRAVLNGYAQEFTSSSGDFILHVLNIDWSNRTISVQVSRKD